MNLRFLIITCIISLMTHSCCEKDESPAVSEDSYLIFGHFYGMCIGDQCVEIFKLEDAKLMEDLDASYPNREDFYSGSFTLLGADKYQLVDDLMSYFPEELLMEQEIVLGCPDCADQGGLYVEYQTDEIHRRWMIDQSKDHVPEYLHEFMDIINSKIGLINGH